MSTEELKPDTPEIVEQLEAAAAMTSDTEVGRSLAAGYLEAARIVRDHGIPAQSTPNLQGVVGWAVVENGTIKIKSVSDTRRAAIINFLVTDRGCTILNAMTDEHVERIWFQNHDGAEVENVTICETLKALPPQERDAAQQAREALKAVDDMSLIITSAVNWCAPDQNAPVIAAIKKVRTALAAPAQSQEEKA